MSRWAISASLGALAVIWSLVESGGTNWDATNLGLLAGGLVVLSVGWPPTPAQRRAVDGAMQAAAERGFACSAHLVWSAGEIEDHLQPHDDVLVTSPSPLPTEVPAFA